MTTIARAHLGLVIAVAALAVARARDPAPDVTPRPALLVLNKAEATLAVVDPASNVVVGRVPTGEGPHEMAVSEDGSLAFVSNYGTGQSPGRTISVIDLRARRELRRVELGALRRPHGIAVAAGRVYFTAEANRLIGSYDPVSNQIDWLMGTGQDGTHMVLPNADASEIATANIASNTVTLFQRTQGQSWTATSIQVGAGPEGLDRSPDGREVWVAHSRDGGVSIIDPITKRVVQTLALGTKRSNRLKFTPNGRRVLISDLDAGELIVIDAVTRAEVTRLHLGGTPEGIQIPPDGSRTYVALAADNVVAIVDLASLSVTGRIATGAGPDGMAWRP